MTKRTNSRGFGYRPLSPSRELERRHNRRGALVFAIMAFASFCGAFGFNQPIFALAAFLFLVTAVIVAKDA